MIFAIMDMETDGLIKEVTKMHCFVVSVYENNKFIRKGVITEKQSLENFFNWLLEKEGILIGHNIIRYDLPVIKKLFGLEYKGKAWDTLAMSFKLFPDQSEHGLEYYGNKYKVPKPKIHDWENLSLQDYIHRCTVDVEINTILFSDLYAYFKDIYFPHSPIKDIEYCTWKMDCAREQEENPIKVNKRLISETLESVNQEIYIKTEELKKSMPLVIKYKTINPPPKMLKKDGSLSVAGEKWLDLLKEKDLPKTHLEPIEIIAEKIEPNPGSPQQLKDWLFSLGWEPTIYKTRVSKVTGKVKEVPQIQNDDKELCPDITESLLSVNPELFHLEGYFMLKHRKGVFEAFLENIDENDFIVASVAGFTNTMRFKHRKPIANMPGVRKPYGKQIRGALIARDENYLFCGSDMSSLEDSTKQHYMYYYDPEYVKEMRIPGFDPHTDIAVFAGLMTKEEEETFKYLKNLEDLDKDQKEILSYLSGIRTDAKVVNFAGVYGAGPLKLMKVLKCDIDFAKKLHTAYWKRNKAVKEISRDAIYKSVRKQLWLWNPVAQMWYYLKNTKDIFSTLNQGTGVYCFDTWLRNVRNQGIKIMLQYHDELGFDFLKTEQDKIKEILNSSIKQANQKLKLNVPLGISIDIGDNYGEAH